MSEAPCPACARELQAFDELPDKLRNFIAHGQHPGFSARSVKQAFDRIRQHTGDDLAAVILIQDMKSRLPPCTPGS